MDSSAQAQAQKKKVVDKKVKRLKKKRPLPTSPSSNTTATSSSEKPQKLQKKVKGTSKTKPGDDESVVAAIKSKVVFACDVSTILLRVLQQVYPTLASISFVAGKVGYCFGLFPTPSDVTTAASRGLVQVNPSGTLHAKAEVAKRPQTSEPTAFISFSKMAFLLDVFEKGLPPNAGLLAVQGIVSSGVLVKFTTPEQADVVKQKGSFTVLGDIPVQVQEQAESATFDKKKQKQNQGDASKKRPREATTEAMTSPKSSATKDSEVDGDLGSNEISGDEKEEKANAKAQPKKKKAKVASKESPLKSSKKKN